MHASNYAMCCLYKIVCHLITCNCIYKIYIYIYIYTLYKHIKCSVLNAFIYWVAQKVPSVFKQNYKTNFSFSPRTLLNNIFTILIYYLLPFFGQLHNSYLSKTFYLSEKKLFQVPFTVF